MSVKFNKVNLVILVVMFLLLIGSMSCYAQERPFEGVNLTFVWYPSPEMDAAKELAPAFTEETGATVTFMEVPHSHMYEKVMMEAVSGAGIIDLWGITSWWVSLFGEHGYIIPLNQFFEKYGEPELEDIFPGVLDMYTFDGNVYAVPLYPDAQFLFYNSEMLSEAGVQVPTTFEDFEVASKKFSLDTNGDGTTDRFGSVWNLYQDESITQNFLTMLYMAGGDFMLGQKGGELPFSEDEYMRPIFNNESGVAALEYMTHIYKDEILDPGSINYSFFEALEAFATKQAALYIGYGDQAPMALSKDSHVVDVVEFAPMPAFKGVSRTCGGGWGVAISATSKNKEAAYAFVKYFYGNKENALKLANFGNTPTRISVFSNPELQDKFNFYEAMRIMLMDRVKSMPLFPEFPEANLTVAEYLQGALVGLYTPKDALDIAAEKVTQIMERAGYYK